MYIVFILIGSLLISNYKTMLLYTFITIAIGMQLEEIAAIQSLLTTVHESIVLGDLDYADKLLVEIDHICLLNKFTKQNPSEFDIKVHASKVDKLVSNAKLAAKKGQVKLCL